MWKLHAVCSILWPRQRSDFFGFSSRGCRFGRFLNKIHFLLVFSVESRRSWGLRARHSFFSASCSSMLSFLRYSVPFLRTCNGNNFVFFLFLHVLPYIGQQHPPTHMHCRDWHLMDRFCLVFAFLFLMCQETLFKVYMICSGQGE